jgi:hypothetical protein
MLLTSKHLEGIAGGKIKLAFRKWKKPTVKTGGRLRTHIGVLAIHSVDQISEKEISNRDAKLAGFKSRAELLQELKMRDGLLYRIRLSLAGQTNVSRSERDVKYPARNGLSSNESWTGWMLAAFTARGWPGSCQLFQRIPGSLRQHSPHHLDSSESGSKTTCAS